MDRTACTEPQCQYKGALYFMYLYELKLTPELSEPWTSPSNVLHTVLVYRKVVPELN